MTRRRRTLPLALAGLLLAAHSGWAQTVGVVVNVEPGVIAKTSAGTAMLGLHSPVAIGSELETSTARVTVFLPNPPSQLDVGPNSKIRIVPPRPRGGELVDPVVVLEGQIHTISAGEVYAEQVEVAAHPGSRTASACDVENGASEFIVKREPAGTIIVIAIAGQLDVRTPSKNIVIDAGWLTEIPKGGAPIGLRKLAEFELQEKLRVFEFIGRGEAQSQVLDNVLVLGAGLKEEDRSTWLTLPMARDERRRFADPPIDNPPTAVDLSIQF